MSPILGIIASSITGGLVTSSFESIATTTLSSDTNTISFTSIPATFKHLQIRILGKGVENGASVAVYFKITVNSDTGSNYARHFLYGDETSVAVAASSSTTPPIIGKTATSWVSVNASTYGMGIIDIHDYASTSKYKTIRSISGVSDNSVAGWLQISSALWQSTSAITRLDFIPNTSDWLSGTSIALYGIKG